MPKEKKKGLFSLFRKKVPKEQPMAVVSPPNSYVDINDLIPSTEFSYQKPIEATVKSVVLTVEKEEETTPDPVVPEKPREVKELKVERPKKKARAAPPPPRERAVDVGGEVPKKPPRDLNILSVEEKKAIIRKQLSEDQEQEIASSRKSSESSGSRVVETNVLHYSPQTQNRPSGSSPIPVSEAPPVERQSNIILNGTARIKTIPVTQYDGRPKQAAPPPPLVLQERVMTAAVPPPIAEVASPTTAYHKKQMSLDSAMSARTPKLDAPPKALYRSPVSTISGQHVQKSKEEEILQRRYEDIKRKFDLWQALKSDERQAKEAKKLHMELIRDHDSLMAIVNQSNGEQDVPSPGQTQRKRPSIAPDTYTPRLPVTNGLRFPLSITATHSSNSLGSSNSSSPGTSRSVTPKNAVSSSPSVSPSASVDSSDSGVVRNTHRSDYATPRVEMKKSQSIDENSNHLKRISKPRDSLEIQKQHAINRINDEVRAQRVKEQELKRFSQPALMHIEVGEKTVSNAYISESVKTQSKLPPKEPEPLKSVQSPKQSSGVSRVIVNASPVPTPVPKQSLAPKPIPGAGKTVVAMNKPQEKIYATPKPVAVRRPLESPKTPPLPATPHPKLPYMSRTMSADEVIYKVSKKEENNNNVAKLSPVKGTKPARSPTSDKKRRHVTKESKPVEKPQEVTSAIKTTIRETSRVESTIRETSRVVSNVRETSRVEAEVKTVSKDVTDDKGTVSRNIANTLAKHNTHSRPALDLSLMLEQTTLRKVEPPVERHGIAMGRVVDPGPVQPSTSSAPTVTYIPPPPPPMMMTVPPPPPPPADLMRSPIYQVPSPIVRPSSIPMAPPAPPPLVTSSQLTDQKQRLRTPIIQMKSSSSPLDLRDSLMAEIRNAAGGTGLRKVNRN